MQLTRITSTADAQRHLESIRQPGLTVAMEFDEGWVLIPSSAPTGVVGTAASILDRRTGTVTVQGSAPPKFLAAQYASERRQGRIRGNQIWPWTSTSALTHVRALRREQTQRDYRVIEIRDQIWTMTPLPTPDETTAPPVTYLADGETLTIWEYPQQSAMGSTYLVERAADRIRGRPVYPIPD